MADLTSTTGYVALGAVVVALLALLVAAVALVRLRRLRADQLAVLGGGERSDLVAHAAALSADQEALRAHVTGALAALEARLEEAEGRLDRTIAARGLVRYDAYNEMSGRQSTSIALLDAHRSGLVLSSIHHRDQSRLYVKSVVGGVGEVRLSPEEEQVVRAASDISEPLPAPEA